MNSYRCTHPLMLLILATAPMVIAGCEGRGARFESEDEGAWLTSVDKLEGPCPYNLTAYRGQNNTQVSCSCGPVVPSAVWGTGIYTDDSSVCTAAAHAGTIPMSGGSVIAIILPGQASYQGSTKNGITSFAYGQWYGSFVTAPGYSGEPAGGAGGAGGEGGGGAGGRSETGRAAAEAQAAPLAAERAAAVSLR